MRPQRGFSLIEIVVTIAVLAMILFAALPSIGTYMENTRIRNVADSLQNGLQTARGEAVRRNQEVSFWLVRLNNPSTLSNDCTLSGSSGSWVVSINSPVGHCADDPSTTSSPMLVTGRAVGDSGGRVGVSAFRADNTAANVVTFNGFGRVPVTSTESIRRIEITGTTSGVTSRNLHIAITAAGQVRMCDPEVTDANDPRRC
jgi:type IV fimbrial biogenesis protein FimT